MVILSNTYPVGFKYSVASNAVLEEESGRKTLKVENQGGEAQPYPGMDHYYSLSEKKIRKEDKRVKKKQNGFYLFRVMMLHTSFFPLILCRKFFTWSLLELSHSYRVYLFLLDWSFPPAYLYFHTTKNVGDVLH